jgi:hypothetical protein
MSEPIETSLYTPRQRVRESHPNAVVAAVLGGIGLVTLMFYIGMLLGPIGMVFGFLDVRSSHRMSWDKVPGILAMVVCAPTTLFALSALVILAFDPHAW